MALTTVRATYGTASASEADLKEIVSTEESRVADAAVIAELIAARLAPPSLAKTSIDAAPSTQPSEESNPPSLPTPIPFPVSSTTASPLSIADLLDGMLAQEKRDVRHPAHN